MRFFERPIFNFAFFLDFSASIKELSNIALDENWSFSDSPDNSNEVLSSYFVYTFERLKFESKILYSQNNRFSAFNTGLMDKHYQYIYAFFRVNRVENKQPYFFLKFCTEYDVYMRNNFEEFPKPADYFSDPSLLIYNPKLSIIKNIDHICNDNVERFPENLRGDVNLCRRSLEGAITETEKRLRANYKLAVPYCFNGKIQLLIPLYLTDPSGNADLALSIEKEQHNYLARTCLTMRMAYQNARLIVRPESSWLKP